MAVCSRCVASCSAQFTSDDGASAYNSVWMNQPYEYYGNIILPREYDSLYIPTYICTRYVGSHMGYIYLIHPIDYVLCTALDYETGFENPMILSPGWSTIPKVLIPVSILSISESKLESV
jgi:hypothetical protein